MTFAARRFRTRSGLPATSVWAGTFLVTTEPAAMTADKEKNCETLLA